MTSESHQPSVSAAVQEAIDAARVEVASILREYWQASALEKGAPALNAKWVLRLTTALEAIARVAREEGLAKGMIPNARLALRTGALREGIREALEANSPDDTWFILKNTIAVDDDRARTPANAEPGGA